MYLIRRWQVTKFNTSCGDVVIYSYRGLTISQESAEAETVPIF